MEKVFVNPKKSIKNIICKSKEWGGGRRTKGCFVVGSKGKEVGLEITYVMDGINHPYLFGKVTYMTHMDRFPPIEDNENSLDWINEFVMNFYERYEGEVC